MDKNTSTVQEMVTKDCREDWQNCINALSFGRCALHGDGLTDAERIEQDHLDALDMEAR